LNIAKREQNDKNEPQRGKEVDFEGRIARWNLTEIGEQAADCVTDIVDKEGTNGHKPLLGENLLRV
jgi:hypothetical protein